MNTLRLSGGRSATLDLGVFHPLANRGERGRPRITNVVRNIYNDNVNDNVSGTLTEALFRRNPLIDRR